MGRPPGTKTGRIPDGGYPEISPEDGAFLAGFLEGEACFTISKQSGKANHACNVGLVARADDADLLAELAARTRLGSLHDRPARGTSAAQVAWSISAKSDCKRLTEILDRYPLRGRKSHDYAIWKAAVEWWVGDDAGITKVGRDWAPMEYLKRRLEEVRRFDAATSPLIDDDEGLRGDWGGYLAGFFTAEGTFGIYQRPNRLWPRAGVHLRADDAPLLTELCQRSGVGHVYGPHSNSNASPSVCWWAVSSDDLHRLVWALSVNPPRGRKRRELEVWARAVRLIGHKQSPKRAQAALRALRDQLAEVRAGPNREIGIEGT